MYLFCLFGYFFAQDGELWEELRKTVEDESVLTSVTLTKNDKGKLLMDLKNETLMGKVVLTLCCNAISRYLFRDKS